MPLLSVRQLHVRYPLRHGASIHAVNDVSFDLNAGQTLSIVGESGCGKSSLARVVAGLISPSAGQILWRGDDIATLDPRARQALKRSIQIIFQDPLASLDPRMTVAASIVEPLAIFEPHLAKIERGRRLGLILDQVELPRQIASRFPHELSGGQCQRVAIARAMILEPALLVCDEAVSALDVSVQAQIVNLLRRLQQEAGLSLLFISHNLGVVRHLGHRVAVLYLGRAVEAGPAAEVFATPAHPYTQALLSAIPIADPVVERARQRVILAGEPPSPANPPSGCVFRTRCPLAIARCGGEPPVSVAVTPGHHASCHLLAPPLVKIGMDAAR